MQDIQLDETKKAQLDGNIKKMLEGGATEEDIMQYASDFKNQFGQKKNSASSQSSATKLPLQSQPINPLQQGANIVGGGVISDISAKSPKKENEYFKQIAVGIRPSAQGDIVERIYENPMGVDVLQIAPPKREQKPKEVTAKAETKDKSLRGVKPIPAAKYEYEDVGQGDFLNTVSALDRGFYKNLVGNPVKGLGTLLEQGTAKITGGSGKAFISDALISFGDYFNNAIDELAPQDENFKNSLLDQFGQAFGQVASLVATGGAGGLGKTAAASTALKSAVPKAASVSSAAKTLGSQLLSPTSVSAGLSMGQSEFDRAKQAGATDEQAFEVFYKNAAVGSILEKIPVMQFLKRFNQATKGGVANYIKTKGVAGITGGLEEMTTETLQQLYANKTARDVYNLNESIFNGLAESGGVGFGVGFLLNAMGAKAKILRKQGKVADATILELQIDDFKEKAKTQEPATKQAAPSAISDVNLQEQVEVLPTRERFIQEGDKFYEVVADGRQMTKTEITEDDYNKGKLLEESQKQQFKTEADAIPKQTAGQVPIQSETTVSEEVEKGVPATKLEEAAPVEVNEEEIKRVFRKKDANELGNAIYTTTNKEMAKNYSTGEGTLKMNRKQQEGVVYELSIPKNSKIFDLSDETPNDELFDELSKNKDFLESWNNLFSKDVPKANREIWYAAEEAGFNLQKYLQDKGYVGARHKTYQSEGSKSQEYDYGVWDESILKKGHDENSINIYRGVKKSEPKQEEGEEVKLERQEAEPPAVEGGRRVATISGLTEEERVDRVEKRKKSTALTKEEVLNNDLVDLTNQLKTARGLEKANTQAKIRQKVLGLNAEAGFEKYRFDGVSVRKRTKSKTKGVRYTKINRTSRDSSGGAIKEDAVLLTDRSPEFTNIFEALVESPALEALQVDRGDGTSMTKEQIQSALEDVLDGIPSVAADNLLNTLEEGFNRGFFDLRAKDLGIEGTQTVQAMLDEFIGAEKEVVGEPMDEEALLKFLEEESKLELEEDIELLDNIENLITEYESEPTKTITKGEVSSTKTESETRVTEQPKPTESRKSEGKPKTEVSRQPDEKAKGEPKPKAVEKKEEAPKKISDKAREQAAKLRSGEANVLPDWLRANLPKGTKKQGADINDVYAKALEVFAETYDKLGDFKKAVDEAFKGISDWFKENGIDLDEADIKSKFEAQLKGEAVEEGGEKRRFTKQMLATEGLENKEKIAETLKYVKQTNALSIEQANKIIDEIGLDEAFILVQSDADINGGVRSVLSQMLISRYNNLSRTATNKADKQFYWDKTVEVANFVTKKLATESGRIIQAFSIWGKLSPEALIRSAVRDMEAQGEFAKKKAKADVNKIGNKLKKANEEAIEEVLESEEFSNAASRAETKSKSKAEAKIKAAKEKRKNIINKYKGKGGITFTSGGITKEGIEFIGEMAKTYIEEGLANIELIVEKIAENIKEVSGKDATGEVLAEVKKIAEKKLAASDTKLIGKGLRDMNVKIASVVRKHFIEAELVKTKLAEKLVSEAGLEGEEATELANRVMAAFDRIATKKKAKILQDEVENLERAKRKLKGTVEVTRRELQDEILKVTNLGGFDNEQLLDILANKVGTGKLTPQEGARLQFLAQRVKEAPEGSPRNEAIQELFNYQANLKGTSKGEVGQAIWYASLLAGYKTHIKNIVANAFNTVMETVVSAIGNPKASGALVKGLFKGYQRGLIEARHTLRTGKSPIHINKIEASDVLERTSFKGGAKNPFNWLKYVLRFMVASDVFAFQGLKESRAYQMAYMEAAKMKKEDAALKDVSIWRIINDKLLDTPERKKEAELKVKAEGQVGVEAKRRMYELMEQSRPEKMQDETYSYAAMGTFNYPPIGTLGAINNSLAYVLDLPIGGVKPLRFVVPFTRILTNVANNALDYEPITGTIRAVRGKRGFESFETMTPTKGTFREMTPEERKRQIIKAGVGITALSTLYALSKMKDDEDEPILEITGSGSQDYVKTNQLKERGWKPYSIKIGDTYYSYELTPLLLTLGYIGNLNDFEKYDAKSDSEVIDKMSQTAFRMQDAVSNMIFIGTLADFMDMGWDNTKTRGQKIQRYLENLGKTSIPFMQPVTQISQGVQEIMELPKKETTKLGYSLIKDIPIARNALYNKINVLGEEIPTKSALIVSKKTTNDSWEFLENNRIFLAPINRKTVIGYNAEKGMDMPATDEQFYNFSKMRGQMIKSVIESIKKNNGLTVLVDGKPVKKSWKELNSGEYKQEVDDFLEKKTAQATKKAKEIIFTKKEEDYDLEINKILRDIENIGVGEFE